MRGEKTLIVRTANSVQGTIEVPGDKSISHRALIFGSLCGGRVEITGFLPAEDCLSTLKCLRQLGVQIEQRGTDVTVHGVGKYGFKVPKEPLDVGNSGTTLRILPGLLAAQNFESNLVGDASVSARPIDRIIKPLSLMGADIQSTDGHAPINIKGSKLSAISYKLPVASAQVKSAILLAGLFAQGQTTVSEEFRSRDHTERMLSYLEADLKIEDKTYTIRGNSTLKAKPIIVPGDVSSAALFIIAALLLESSELTIKNLGLNPTRIGLLEVFQDVGASISKENERLVNNEPIADLIIESSLLKPFTIGGEQIPLLVDEIPILAVAATQIDGTSVINGAEELRVKESDRLKSIATQLNLLGAKIEEKPDGLIIEGPTRLKGAVVDSGGDHRIAMSLAIAGLLASGQTTIKNAECIAISFPNFKELLDEIIT